MSKVDFLDLFSRNKKRTEQPKQTLTYNLRLQGQTFPDFSSDQEIYDEDTLRVMPPDSAPKLTIQPLSLPEKKYLYDFWIKQWEIFKAAPACQNVSEKRLHEKFDGYVSINIRRCLLKDWNNTFAGGYVSGEPEARQERECDDLRALTKSWSWLCKELGFKPWPLSIDHEDENLEEVKIDVRSSPFNIHNTRSKRKEFANWYIDSQRLIPVQTYPRQAGTDGIGGQQTKDNLKKFKSQEKQDMEDFDALYRKIATAHELEIAEKEHLMRIQASLKEPIKEITSTENYVAKEGPRL